MGTGGARDRAVPETLDFGPRGELELIQSHMAQKPVLRGEVGCACVAREVSVERGGMGERGCARRLGGWVWPPQPETEKHGKLQKRGDLSVK